MDDIDEGLWIGVLLFVGFLWLTTIAITAGGCHSTGEQSATARIRNEAVLAGAAEWKPGEKGEAVFTWKGGE